MTAGARYTVLVRLPFARGDFVDPSPANWDSASDALLWNVLSEAAAKGRDLDWNALADRFGVTLAFLSQQAAWLYEKQLSQVRAQLRNVNRPSSSGNSPTPGSTSAIGNSAGYIPLRAASGVGRLPASIPQRQIERRVSQGEDGANSSRGIRGSPISRNPSTSTVTQLRDGAVTLRSQAESKQSFAQRRQSRETTLRTFDTSLEQRRSPNEAAPGPSAIANDSSDSSSSESEALHPMVRSRAFARRPRYSSAEIPSKTLSDADEEEEEEDDETPHFLPFSTVRTESTPQAEEAIATESNSPKDPSARRFSAGLPIGSKPQKPLKGQALHSSSSSAQSQPQSQRRPSQKPLSALSPRQRRIAKEGSDGSPSMGSSFSDLDDASITQSALEDALANEMAHGGVASRMSTISQALKSKYL